MNTILEFVKTERGFYARNQTKQIDLLLPLTHEVARIFPPQAVACYAKCNVRAGKVTILNSCKLWKKEPANGSIL